MEKIEDILKTAIEHEVHAEIFYTKAADLTENDQSRTVFQDLADVEEDHSRRLVERFENSPLIRGLDLKAFLNETEAAMKHLLTLDETQLIRTGDMAAVLDFAIGREEQARDNYQSLARSLEDGDDCEFCLDLAKEENRHREILTRLRRSLDMDPDERPDL